MYARVFVVSWVTGGWKSSDTGVRKQTWVLFNSSTDLTTEPSLESLSSNRVLILRFIYFYSLYTGSLPVCMPVHRVSTVRIRGQIKASDPPWTGVRQWAQGAGNQIQVLLKAVIHRSSPGQQVVLESNSPDFKIFTEHLRNKRISVHHSWHCL